MWFLFFFSSRRRHTRCSRDWSSDVCSSDLQLRRSLSKPWVQRRIKRAYRAGGLRGRYGLGGGTELGGCLRRELRRSLSKGWVQRRIKRAYWAGRLRGWYGLRGGTDLAWRLRRQLRRSLSKSWVQRRIKRAYR